ncbi:DUF5676 family membrane protein [Alteromonas sp. NFXS44]|uniref:DUF5676 family membrane protein n=1 Tax=Alteromonas sp. NFXS44 TaxID=2818435 RepID=UPI0032DE6F06
MVTEISPHLTCSSSMLSHINLKIQSPRLRGYSISPRIETLLLSHNDDRYCVAHRLAMDGMAHARIVIGGVLWVLLTGVLGWLIAIIYNRQ